jgi:damage-control phosphatase, subfamily I
VKTFLDCIPCFMNQALRAGRIATDDESVHKEILNRVGSGIRDLDMALTPPEIALTVYREIREVTGVEDPFRDVKREHIREANRLYPKLERMVAESSDPLLTAVRIAIAGNVIDLGTGRDFHIERDIGETLKQEFAICHMEDFRSRLRSSESILYLGDNAGESVFDRLLLKVMEKPAVYAVRDRAVINDVTMEDALISGLSDVATVISSGSPAPATILDLCNEEFLRIFSNADMIISKGQGNYEGLSDERGPIFFMLKAKCPVIARDLAVRENSIVLKLAGHGDSRDTDSFSGH